MPIQIITIHVDDQPIKISVRSARKFNTIRRTELIMESENIAGGKGESELRKTVAQFIYPTCMASVELPVSTDRMPIEEFVKLLDAGKWTGAYSFNDFVTRIDDADIDTWTKTAYELNPQWRQGEQILGSLIGVAQTIAKQAAEKTADKKVNPIPVSKSSGRKRHPA
jgi:hypothetical protein